MEKDESSKQMVTITFPDNVTVTNPVETHCKYLVSALTAIKDNLSIAGSLIIIIGYVIIAAFGKMKDLKDWIGYFLFLGIAWAFYRIKRKTVEPIIYFFAGIIFLLLLYIEKLRGFVDLSKVFEYLK